MLSALEMLHDTLLIFTMPNADPNGRKFFSIIKNFVKQKKWYFFFSWL